MRFMRVSFLRLSLFAAGVIALTGCASTPAGDLATTPGMGDVPTAKCLGTKNKNKPFLVDWHASDRGDLETAARNNLVVVKYDGCQLHVMSHCEAAGNYNYLPFQPKQDRIRITDANQLYTNVPMGAAKLEAKLAQSGELGVDTTLVGKYRADRVRFDLKDLTGSCDGATHVVAGMTIGAFEFFARAKARVAGGVSVSIAGAGGDSKAEREVISRDGDRKRCAEATGEDVAPPEGCSSLVRLEVLPITGVDERLAALQYRGYSATLDKPRGGTPLAVWIGGGGGLAVAASGGILIGLAQSKFSEADSLDSEAKEAGSRGDLTIAENRSTEAQAARDAGDSLMIPGGVMAGLGGAGIVTAAILWFVTRPGEPENPVVGSVRWTVLPTLGPSQRGAAIVGKF